MIHLEQIPVPYASLPGVGAASLLGALAAGRAPELDYPLLQVRGADLRVSAAPGRNTAELAAILARGNPHLPPPPGDAAYVVAGQQAGLLGGPLYTLHKAVSLIALARRLSHTSGRTVLPLFWIASEDHDVLEVNRVWIGGRKFVDRVAEEPAARGARPSVASIAVAAETREAMLQFLQGCLPEGPARAEALDLAAGLDFTTYATAFRSLFVKLLGGHGLRFVEPAEVRALAAPTFARLAECWPQVQEAFTRGTDRVTSAGFNAPLAAPGFFEFVEGSRIAVEHTGRGFRMAAGEVSYAQAATEIRRRPADFSPNAALRPVLQDAAIPVAAMLGGPAELAYLWQIDELYATAGVARAPLYPRASFTWIEPRVRRAAEKNDLWPARIFEAAALAQQAAAAPAAPAGLAEAQAHAGTFLASVDSLLGTEVSPQTRKRREALADTISRFLERAAEELQAREGVGRQRLERLAEAVAPAGKLQERIVCVFPFLAMYGHEWIEALVAGCDPLALEHRLLVLPPVAGTAEG